MKDYPRRGKNSVWGKRRGKTEKTSNKKALYPLRYKAFSLAQKEGFEPSRRFYPAYSLSRGAPSATWVLPQIYINFRKIGGESGIRTHGDLRLAGFQDRFLQPLGHLSVALWGAHLSNT